MELEGEVVAEVCEGVGKMGGSLVRSKAATQVVAKGDLETTRARGKGQRERSWLGHFPKVGVGIVEES